MHSWPLFELVLHTPRLTLRLAPDADLDALAKRAVGRVLDAERMDFMSTDWTQLPSPLFERSFLQFHWGLRSRWTSASWSLDLAAYADGEPVGAFALFAEEFVQQRAVNTGSWLLPEWRGRGLGVEGRAAMLALAFDGLGAEVATSTAHADNAASLGVSRSLGYEQTGTEPVAMASGHEVPVVGVRLTRERWAEQDRPPVEISGLDACRELFGLA